MTDDARIENALTVTALAAVRASHAAATCPISELALRLAAASRLDAAARALRENVQQDEDESRVVERAHARAVAEQERCNTCGFRHGRVSCSGGVPVRTA